MRTNIAKSIMTGVAVAAVSLTMVMATGGVAQAAADTSGVKCAKAAKAVGLLSGEGRVTMVAIALGESNCNNQAVSPTSDYGAWQINKIHGYNKNKLLNDINYNAKAAKKIQKSQGYRAWVAYQNGRYKQFVSTARKAVNKVG